MNSSWREAILKEFIPQLSPLTLVADPDVLLTDERIQEALQGLGFMLVEYQEPIAFRYFFETTIRPSWVTGEQREWAIVLHNTPNKLLQLPYDLLQYGRPLHFSLSALFPHLTYHEVASLNKSDLDALYQAQKVFEPKELGENSSRDFILRHVYGVDAALVKNEEDLLALLLRLHMRKRPLPVSFATRLRQQLQRNGRFGEWPLDTLLADTSALFGFLQERWPLYLDNQAKGGEMLLRDTDNYIYNLHWPGPALLAFDAPDIRAFVDTLFLEGKLRPVSHSHSENLKNSWVSIGLEFDPARDRETRLIRLLHQLEERLPDSEADHQEWLTFAAAWGGAVNLLNQPLGKLIESVNNQFDAIRSHLDTNFREWLTHHYRYLATLSPHPPVMVHHIPRSMARHVNANTRVKAALIVLDGMAFDQWLVVRDILAEQLPDVRFREEAVFAWIPTITAVSRQALFAGKIPLYFPDSISTTAKESAKWSLFWEENGLTSSEVGYAKKLRSKADLDMVEQLLEHPKKRILGLVVDQIDYMMHGMTLGLAGLHQQIRLWMQAGFLATLLQQLKASGFQIFLTSDHGNVEAIGNGRPGEQSLADVRGERVRIYPNDILRNQVNQRFETALPWPTEGLPPSFYPLIAPNRTAFITQAETTVTHGGNLLEEVIVPLVQVEWRNT